MSGNVEGGVYFGIIYASSKPTTRFTGGYGLRGECLIAPHRISPEIRHRTMRKISARFSLVVPVDK